MADFYSQHEKHHVAVDVIIFGFDGKQLRLLLVKRDFEPCRGDWSLMGGFLGSDENPDQAAARVLQQLTGLQDIYLEQIRAFGDVHRDPAGRVISLSYYSLVSMTHTREESPGELSGEWFPVDSLPELIFDHNEMVGLALKRLRRRCRTEPVGLELLSEKFSIPQLLSLYEAIYRQNIDKRNFRKKILSFNVLEKLEEKDKNSSRKGAFLYRFNREKYMELKENGGYFGF